MLEALSSYQLGTEDRDTFNTMFPSGIPIDSKDVRDFGMFIIFPDGVKSPKVISVDHLETWFHRIGKLPSVLNERLGTLGNDKGPDFEKNYGLGNRVLKVSRSSVPSWYDDRASSIGLFRATHFVSLADIRDRHQRRVC